MSVQRPRGLWVGFVLSVCLWGSAWAQADALQSLAAFLQQAQSGRAEFTQTVTQPPKGDQAPMQKISRGQFSFQRPDRFRFEYRKPFVQVIVADGKTLWFYDADLEQVSARPQGPLLAQTPAGILASARNLSDLQQRFELRAEATAEGVRWVRATPRATDSGLQSVRLGLRGEGSLVELVEIDTTDSFGQRSQIRFERFELNPASLPRETFVFVPPKGVEVTR